MSSSSESLTLFLPAEGGQAPIKFLVVASGDEPGVRFGFSDRIEIGRLKSTNQLPGRLLIRDATVSSRHCIVTQDLDGRCFIRDVSRNGTRVDGRRLSPNLRTEIRMGQVISIGRDLCLRLEGEGPGETVSDPEEEPSTHTISDVTNVTVLVGDITNYTTMVQEVASHDLEASIGRVFEDLEQIVLDLGGTIKEFQGDALFAFWEEHASSNHAVDACRAALELARRSRAIAQDNSLWQVDGFPLKMDWALASGRVAMHGHGGHHAVGLSMVGEPVVLAFRIEKILDRATGGIITCPNTRRLAAERFRFEPLGTYKVKGFDRPWDLYSLLDSHEPES